MKYIIYYIMKIYKCQHTNKFVRKLEEISVPGVELASNCAVLFTRENTEKLMRDTLKHKMVRCRETSN